MDEIEMRSTVPLEAAVRELEDRLQYPCCLWVSNEAGFARAIVTEELREVSGYRNLVQIRAFLDEEGEGRVDEIRALEARDQRLRNHYAKLYAASFRYMQRSVLTGDGCPELVLETYYKSRLEIRSGLDHRTSLHSRRHTLRCLWRIWLDANVPRRHRVPTGQSALKEKLGSFIEEEFLPFLLEEGPPSLRAHSISAFLFEPKGHQSLIYMGRQSDKTAAVDLAKACFESNKPAIDPESGSIALIVPSNKRLCLVLVLCAHGTDPVPTDDLAGAVEAFRSRLNEILRSHIDMQFRQISRQFVEESPESIIVVNQYGTVLAFNRAAERLFGYQEAEILGTYVASLYGSEARARWVGRMLESAPENRIENVATKVRLKDGSLVSIILSAKQHADRTGKKIGSFSIFRKERPARHAGGPSSRPDYYQGLVINSPAPTVVIDDAGIIETVNRAAAKLFSYRSEELVGESIEMLYVSKREARRVGRLIRIGQDRDIQNLETQTIARDGVLIPVSLSARVLTDERDGISGSIGVFKDLRKMKGEIFFRLAQTTGHETRNSLDAALMRLDAFVNRHASPGQREALSKVEDAILEGVDRIQNLLLLGRPAKLNRQWESAASFVKSLRERFALPAKTHEIRLSAVSRIPDFRLRVDRRQLFQVLSNLFNNSVDAIRQKRGLVEESFAGKIEVLVSRADGEFFVRWRDNGIGIPTRDRSQIFDLWFSNKDVSWGNGIGLYLSKRIIEEHSGVISVESEPGVFTEFILRVPGVQH